MDNLEHNYRVFRLVKGKADSPEFYVAEGAACEHRGAIVVDIPGKVKPAYALKDLVSRIFHAHKSHTDKMRKAEGMTELSWNDDHRLKYGYYRTVEYLGFSFEPSLEQVIYKDEVYCTQRLLENEKAIFLRHMKGRMPSFSKYK